MSATLKFCLFLLCFIYGIDINEAMLFKQSSPHGHRCGVCPTYFQKICAFDPRSNSTFIFDNHCIMDLYNCIENTTFSPLTYDHCLFFGNFAYVHGFKMEDLDYGEDHIIVHDTQKNDNFV